MQIHKDVGSLIMLCKNHLLLNFNISIKLVHILFNQENSDNLLYQRNSKYKNKHYYFY